MRVSDSCFLALVLLLLICIFHSDQGRAFRPSVISKVPVVSYHSVELLAPMKENTRINHVKVRLEGGSVPAAHEPKNFMLTGRKLQMKLGVSREELSNNGKNSAKRKISGRTRKRTNMKRVKKKGNQRDEGGVGAFTEDYRVPRPHPPRNN